MEIKKVSKLNILYIAESIIFLVLCFFFTPKIDDIIFHYNEFFQFNDLKSFFHCVMYYGNGRILGNALCFFFAKIPKVFYFVEFVLVQLFCFSTEKLVGIKHSKIYFLTIFLFQPIFNFIDVASWLCGFINYFIPILLLVLVLLVLKGYSKEKSKVMQVFSCIAIVVLGVSEQLFMQHNTAVNLLISLMFFAFCIYKKKNLLPSVLLIISNIAGFGILFGYKYYIDIEQTWADPNYNSLIFSLDGVSAMIYKLEQHVGTFVFFFFSCVVVYTILVLIIFHMDRKDKSIRFKKLNVFLLLLYYPATVYDLWIFFTNNQKSVKYGILLLCLFALNFIGLSYSFIKAVFLKLPKPLKLKTATILLFGVCSIVPLFLVNNAGVFRGNFFFYICVSICVLFIADFAEKEYGFNFEKLLFAFSICACAVCIAYIPAFYESRCAYNFKEENYKTEYILPSCNKIFGDNDSFWKYAEGNIDHEFIPYKEFKEMQK